MRRVIPRRQHVRCATCSEVLAFVAIDEQDYEDKLQCAGWEHRAPGGEPSAKAGDMCPECADVARMWEEDDED